MDCYVQLDLHANDCNSFDFKFKIRYIFLNNLYIFNAMKIMKFIIKNVINNSKF